MAKSFEELYLETDEEVTSVIDKLKKSKKTNIALLLPRNAVLGQSIVNLKLIYRQATEMQKSVVVISPDRVTRNLADRVGFVVAESADDASFPELEKSEPAKAEAASKKEDEEEAKGAEETKSEAKEVAPNEIAKKRFDGQKIEPETIPVVAVESMEESLANSDTPIEDVAEATGLMDDSEQNNAPEVSDKKHTDDRPVVSHYDKKSANVSGGMIPTRGNLRMYRNQKRKPLLLIAGSLIGVGLIALAVAAITIPSATVKLTVKAQPFSSTVNSTVSVDQTSVDADSATIPGKLQSVDHVTKVSSKTSGKKDQGTKATGDVTIFNAWDSTVHTYPAGTTLTAKNGNQYVLATDVTVPGATSVVSGGSSTIVPGQKAASIEAAQPGDSYNIGATTFTIPSIPKAQQEKIYATSTAATKGGTSKVVGVATQEDIDKLTATAKTQNQTEGLAKVKEGAADSIVLEKAMQTLTQDVATSAKADDVADTLEVSVNGKFQLITFAQADQKQLLEKVLANKIPQGQTLVTQGAGVDVDTSQFELNLVTDKKLELANNLKAFTVSGFDPGEISRNLVAATPDKIVSIASKTVETTAAEVSVTPSWWPRLPLWSQKIKIDLNYSSQ